MTDRQLRDECVTLLLAGHETTALALSWACYLLARHPEAQESLHAELDRVLAARPPSLEDLTALPYTEAVVREALRLYPPAWLMPRLATEDLEIHGYRIAKGTSVVMSQWIVHRDPRWFTDPERFDPNRWSEEFARKLPRFAYFPFGGGPRICVGASFALIEAVLLLAAIAQRFRWSLASAEAVEPVATMTLRPKGGIWLALSRR
jgi:cytochrome P450